MNPLTPEQIKDLKSFTPDQVNSYNRYRVSGLSPERSIALIKKPYTRPVKNDGLIFGENSLGSSVVEGVKEAVVGGVKEIKSDAEKYGTGFAIRKAPLSILAGAGRGVGKVVAGVAETADDITGENVSRALMPVLNTALESDIGQTTLEAARGLNRATRGIAGDILDAANLIPAGMAEGVVKRILSTEAREAGTLLKIGEEAVDASRAGSYAEEFARQSANKGKPLSSYFAKEGSSATDELVDTIIDAGERITRGAGELSDKISSKVRGSIDRKIVRTAETDAVKATEEMFDLYRKGVVPGVKGKAKSIAQIEATKEAVTDRIVPTLAQKYEVEGLDDFARAITSEKKAVWDNIDKGLKDAGEKGLKISTEPIVRELDALLASERAQLSTPLKRAIEKAKRDLVDTSEDGSYAIPKEISPQGAQDIIADLNAQLQSYFRGSTSGTNADVIVDNLVLNNLRKSVDEAVADLGEGSFKQLKSEYADLKMIENDVVFRAIHEAQRSAGLADMTDIFSAGDIAAGLLSPTSLLKGTAQLVTKGVFKDLNSRDEFIRRLFLYGKNLKK